MCKTIYPLDSDAWYFYSSSTSIEPASVYQYLCFSLWEMNMLKLGIWIRFMWTINHLRLPIASKLWWIHWILFIMPNTCISTLNHIETFIFGWIEIFCHSFPVATVLFHFSTLLHMYFLCLIKIVVIWRFVCSWFCAVGNGCHTKKLFLLLWNNFRFTNNMITNFLLKSWLQYFLKTIHFFFAWFRLYRTKAECTFEGAIKFEWTFRNFILNVDFHSQIPLALCLFRTQPQSKHKSTFYIGRTAFIISRGIE